MEYILLSAVIVIAAVIYMIRGLADEKKRERAFEKSLREEYGKRKEKRYPDGRLDAIKRHYNRKGADCFLDDTTCNDIELDRLLCRIDRCFSAAGEEALYSLLRIPVFDEGVLRDRQKLITELTENEEDRIKLQKFFARVGRTDKYSVYDYLDTMSELEPGSNLPHYTADALLLFFLVLSFFNAGAGIFGFITVLIWQFFTYFRYKAKMEMYITSFEYFLRILAMAGELEKSGIASVKEQRERIGKNRARFDGFVRFSWFLTSAKTGSGSPGDVVMDYLRMGLHLNIIKFNSMLSILQKEQDALGAIMEELGYIEALISIGEFATSLPLWCFGSCRDEKDAVLKAAEIYHPLISEPVTNDIALSATRGLLITGSNASGKSTFLKAVAIGQLFSQTITVVPAKSFESGFYRLYTAMAFRDDIMSQKSYFIIEIEAMKRILAALESGQKVMCFIDELLRGTNTVERIAAGSEILIKLRHDGAFVFAATHDIELTALLEDGYRNCHFEESIVNGDVCFNYQLKEGKAQSRNAIKLLAAMGYDDTLINNAKERAESFIKTGEWKR